MSKVLCLLVVALFCCNACHGAPSDGFLPNWFQLLQPVIGDLTLLDISLPGTHDTLTADLSTTVSEGANDIPAEVAWVLHQFRLLTPGKFIRTQAKTQGLSVTEQLDGGIRFLDFRIMYTAGPKDPSTGKKDWYSLHFVQSNQPALTYLTAVREWMDAHPSEILVMWLSRHGDEFAVGTKQYPKVPIEAKQAFWKQIEQLFDGLLFDASVSSLNQTTISELLQRNHRLIIYAADYAEFTGNSTHALSSWLIDNQHAASDDSNITALVSQQRERFSIANVRRANDKRENRFYLMSMGGYAPSSVIVEAAWIWFDPFVREKHTAKCAAIFNIPEMTNWCPAHLQDIAQLSNYYSQIGLDAVITDNLHYPNAIYIDAVDVNGTIRTGTALFSPESGEYEAVGFAYSASIVLYNVRLGCAAKKLPSCADLTETLEKLRADNPLQRWHDPTHGRWDTWP